MKLLAITISLILAIASTTTSAQMPWREAVESKRVNWKQHRATLPPFCAANVKHTPPFNGSNFREDMVWGNHLCEALVKMPICRTYSGKSRIECLDAQTGDYRYWISRAKNPNFGMLPYLHTGLGELYFEIGKKPEAINEFMLALKKNPKYLKAYRSLIDAFIDTKQYDSAQFYLDKAIAIKPNKAFKRRQEKLNKLKQS